MKILDRHGDPIDGGEITPEQEATAQGKAREFKVTLSKTRQILNADQLANLVSPNVRFEDEYKFPDKSAFFFTINGILKGKKVEGALLAGECMLVFDVNVIGAKTVAAEGLRRTIDLLHEEYNTRKERESRDLIQQGINAPDIGGRRAGSGRPGLDANPLMRAKMTAMIRHIYGGEPFRF